MTSKPTSAITVRQARAAVATRILAFAACACASPENAHDDTDTIVAQPTTDAPDAALSLADADVPLFDQCAAVAIEANLVPANFLFILDRSGSMNCVPPNGDMVEAERCKTDPRRRGDGPSKWDITQNALTDALEPLVGRDRLNVAVGAFPSEGSKCGVSAAPSVVFSALDTTQLSSTAALLTSITPDGDTPLAGAAILGYAHLAEELRASAIYGNTFVVLLTDGKETCKPDEISKLLTKDVPLARSGFGIRTFVIGAPGSEDARWLLSQLAFAGGTAASASCDHGDNNDTANCHFDMTRSVDFEADLSAVLDKITQTKALACEFDVPQNPQGGGLDLAKVNVTLASAGSASTNEQVRAIGKHEAPDGTCDGKDDGWTYSEDHRKVLVCGSDCEEIEQTPEAQVRLVLGCPSVNRANVPR